MIITTSIIVAVAALVGSWYGDKQSWRRKPREILVQILRADDWRRYRAAITELRRRGEDVSVYLPRIVGKLASESFVERTAAQVIIKNCFPELAAEIQGYSPSAGVEACRAKAASLLARYGVS